MEYSYTINELIFFVIYCVIALTLIISGLISRKINLENDNDVLVSQIIMWSGIVIGSFVGLVNLLLAFVINF